MKMYKENLGYFYNSLFWVSALIQDSIWYFIVSLGVGMFFIPLAFGWWMSHMEKDIDWTLCGD